MLKSKLSKRILTEIYTINYSNGCQCTYTLIDKKLSNYTFKKGELKLQYTYGLISEIVKLNWTEHYDFFKRSDLKKLTLEELLNDDICNELYYLGMGNDGMLADMDGNFISTPVRLDSDFINIWINGLDEDDEYKYSKYGVSDLEGKENVNVILAQKRHERSYADVTLPQDIYTDFLNSKNKKYVDDIFKVRVFDYVMGTTILKDRY